MPHHMKPQLRTPIKYYGGKTRMLPHILPLIPDHKVYVEAFAGGAALFWAKQPSIVEVLNDINGNVANFYKVLKLNFSELDDLIQTTLHCEHTHNHCKTIYNNPDDYDDTVRAWAFFVCANMSFGGEVAGSFQWVKNKTDNWHPAVAIANRRKQFKIYEGRLDKVCVHDMDAVTLIEKRDHVNTFIYQDPPYVGARQGHYKGYTQSQFTQLLEANSKMKGKFLLSSYSNDILSEYVEKFGWNQKKVTMRLGVSGDNQNKTEVLTWNYTINN